MKREDIYQAIDNERARQDEKWGGRESSTSILPGDDLHAKVSVLGEEFGEVARAVLERDDQGLECELVQVAAVCVAWLEARP